ncbi:ephexin-1 [Clarias gariepinus]
MGSVDDVKAELVAMTKAALFPKNCEKGDIPQKVLDPPPSSTNATRDTQNKPVAKPRLNKLGAPKQTKNRDGNDDHASCDTDTASSCTTCCSCVCHNVSEDGPKKPPDEHNYDSSYISSKNEDILVPLLARPLPEEPWKMTLMNEGYTTDNDYAGVYVEADEPKHDDTAPTRSEIEANAAAPKVLSKKPTLTAEKSMAPQRQSKYLANRKKLMKELCWIFSPENKENPRTVKEIVAKINSSQEDDYQIECCFLPFVNKTKEKEELLQKSIYEVATSERSYLERLSVVVKHFMESPELNSAIAPRAKEILFYKMHEIREISQKFLESMDQNLGSELFCKVICDVVHHYASEKFSAYMKYICNMPCQKDTLIILRKENDGFVEIVNRLEMNPCCNRLSFDSFLSLPFQRILQLKVLMETISKRSASKSEVQASAKAALAKICEVLEICNRELGKMEQFKELVTISNKIEFKYKSLPLVSPLRWLIRDGEVTQLALNKNIFGQKKNCPLRLILFNDLLLLASNKGSDRYVVHDHVHRSLTEVKKGDQVEVDLEGYNVSKVFQLAVMKCHSGQSNQLLLQTSTIEERDGWFEVLKVEKGVYGELDCPQVLCTEAYTGQQPGELSLQPEDKINVFQKTPDGLMEGKRLHDGKRGWFPAKCVKEIVNEHVQRRKLREDYPKLQAAENIPDICQDKQTTCFNIC